MGGITFARASAPGEPTLNTPRLPKEEYERLKAAHVKKLATYFPGSMVACLKEAPEKTDYGDIDFIVGCDEPVDLVDLAGCLGATGVICHHPGFCSLAVRRQESDAAGSSTDGDIESRLEDVSNGFETTIDRVPRSAVTPPATDSAAASLDATPKHTKRARRSREPIIYKHINENSPKGPRTSTNVTAELYAQVDIEIIPSHLFTWREFYSSYGDLGGLIGQIVRAFGFTVSDKGIWLRMKELDDSKGLPYQNIADREGLLWLSSEPDRIMEFLDLKPGRYREGFATIHEMYAWLGGCRLLAMYSSQHKRDTSSDRQKEAKRTVFTRFFIEWLPANTASQADDSSGESQEQPSISEKLDAERERLAEEAVSHFAKSAEYETMHKALVRNVDNATAGHLLRPVVKLHSGREDKGLNEIARAFRRCAGVTDAGTLYLCETSHTDAESELYRLLAEDKQSLKDGEGVDAWTKENWEALRKREREKVKASVKRNES